MWRTIFHCELTFVDFFQRINSFASTWRGIENDMYKNNACTS